MNFAVYKPLDIIGFTGTPFFKTVPNFDFYFFGVYFPVSANIIAQIAVQRFSGKPRLFLQTQLPFRLPCFEIHAALLRKQQDQIGRAHV